MAADGMGSDRIKLGVKNAVAEAKSLLHRSSLPSLRSAKDQSRSIQPILPAA
jgi:hypothetical protein